MATWAWILRKQLADVYSVNCRKMVGEKVLVNGFTEKEEESYNYKVILVLLTFTFIFAVLALCFEILHWKIPPPISKI